MKSALFTAFLLLPFVQVQPNADPKVQSAARLQLMNETAARFEIRVGKAGGPALTLARQPVIRWDNPRSFVVDAATFLWLDRHQPQAIGGMWIKNGHAFFELQSLSAQPLTATVDGVTRWSTSRPGISWEAVADGPAPGASRAERLRQMKQLAQEFSTYAVKTAPDYDDGSIWHLRMMAQPIYRYPEEADDGAIFAYSQGTDPEVFLLFELREDRGTPRWHFSFAPACVWELHAKHGDREVWSRPKWLHTDTDVVYGLVGPFAVDPNLFPPELTKPKAAR